MINIACAIVASLIHPGVGLFIAALIVVNLILSNLYDNLSYRMINSLRFNTFHYTKQWDPIKQDSEIRRHQKIWENYNDVNRH